MPSKTMEMAGVGTGSRFARGLQKAEDWIEPLPEKATEEQRKFFAEHVERWNRPQTAVKPGELAGSDYRTSVMYDAEGKPSGQVVKLPTVASK